MQKTAVILLVVGLVGVALVVAGGVLIGTHYFDKMIHNTVEKSIPLKPDSDSFDNWKDPPADVYMQFYLFDVVNKENISKGAKPIVKERGPYTYREVRDKENITFLDGGELLRYRESKAYVLDLEKSVGDPDNDTITSINLLTLTIGAMLRYENHPILEAVRNGLNALDQTLFIEKTVSELLWGYEVPWILKEIEKFLSWIGIKIPLPDKVGLFTGDTANGTDDGTYTIFTGTGNLDKYNIIDTWKGNGSVPYWTDEYCNMINGTDGSGWHPFIDKKDTLYIFSSDICRSIYTQYNYTYNFHDISLYRFVPPTSVFGDHITNPDNTGFCTPDINSCLGAGVLNVTVCKGAPLIVSQPHFFQGAPEYIDAIDGMHPSKDHQTYIDVEPLTGGSLSLAKKLQINADLQNYTAIQDLDNMNQTIFPIVWVNESALITDDGLHKFKKAVEEPISITKGVKFGLIGVGCLVILIALLIALYVYIVKPRRAGGSFLRTSEDADDDDPLVTA